MVHEFDVKSFLQNLKATKPPYSCPFEKCDKIYKTYVGMRFHLYNFDHINNKSVFTPDSDRQSLRKRGQWHHRHMGRSPSPPDFLRTNNRESLTYAESQKMVEFDIDGKVHRININEPLNIVHVDGKVDDEPRNGGIAGFSSSNNRNNNAINGSANHNNKNHRKCDSQTTTPTTTTNGNTSAKTTKTGKGKYKNGKCGNKVRKEQTPQTPDSSTLVVKLPEPSFRIIEDYYPPDAKQRSNSYYRYIEKSVEDIEEEIEYDMDEEDTAWLDLVNKKRRDDNLPEVPADTFESLMDRLEKESYFQSQNSGKDVGPAIDEDAVCCICNDGECQNSNAILFCDMCNLAVHQECYGVPYIPEGQWLCRRCLQSPSRAVDCVLCPNKGGAFKQTDDNRWSHVVCALWIPEVCFANTVFLEPIDSIGNIPSARWKLSCYICKQRSVGACIQCHKANCYVAFHVTCAQQAGLYMKMEAVKEVTSSGLVTNVKKAAYCDAHTPADENGTTLSGVYSSGEEDSRSELKRMQQTKAKFKEKMKKARKILAEKRSAIPIVSIPTIPLERLTKIAAMISIPKRNQFLQRLLGYWTLKRQSRNGVPLLRRLQISHNNLRKDSHKDGDNEHFVKQREQLKFYNRLRQDLERVRLLVELIRKREKIKRSILRNLQNTVELQLNPYKIFLHNLLSKLREKDTNHFFAEPVSADEVPDYLDFIKNPMDFSTMKAKIDSNDYISFDLFEKDLHLIIENCMSYNDKDTVYHKAALKLREQTVSIIKEAKKHVESYNTRTGLHAQTSPFEMKVSVSATPFVSERLQLEEKLKELEQSLLKAKSQKSGGSRTKRVRSLTAEIANIKDQIKSNTSPSVSVKQSNYSSQPTFQQMANNRISPNKQKQKSHKSKNLNSLINSDSDTTDICENTPTFSHFIDKIEGRKTYNSVSASINSSGIEGLIKSSSPNKQNPIINNKESTPKRTNKSSNSKSLNDREMNDKTGPETAKMTNSRTNHNKKRKLNGSPISDALSPNSTSPTLNSGKFGIEKSFSLRKKSHSSSKLMNSRTLTADASTCTPTNMFTETAESFAREQASRGQTSGVKRRSNRNSSRPNKRQNTSSNSGLRLMDQTIPFAPIMPQTESFSVYRNLNSPADSDVVSESSHSHSSSASSKSSGSSGTSHTNTSVSSLGSSGTSSRVSAGNKKKSPRRPPSRSSRSDISIENQKIPLQPNDVVWAKCSGYPWYPALIVNPDASDYSTNGNVIPIPPNEVLAHRLKEDKSNQYLVSFFDVKRTWQWLPRNKLEPLGIDNIDQSKLSESRKASDRKNVQKAFAKAIEFAIIKKGMCSDSSNGD